jgi:general secretion pathway protein D
MKKSAYVRFSITLLLLLSMLSPMAVLAGGDGKKRFKQGLKHEIAEEWDKAAEEFALAIVENPKDPEYRLHYQRSLFNASQMFMKQGRTQAEQGDYAGAYISFRKAYGYDPVNELAKSEMERMVRLQKMENGGENPDNKANPDGVKLVQTNYNTYNGIRLPNDVVIPQQLEKLRDVPFPNSVDLQWLIKELSKDLDLNVLFDNESRLEQRKIKIELKNVTAAKALDYIFLQENLFFQKVGPRTILIANGQQRQKFQQLVLRTFYLANANPKDVENIIKTAIPAQPGRTPTIVLKDDATNSITIRDTSENIRLMSKLISSLDKDRAEVVMDVQIFEVSKSDLLRLGNQIGGGTNANNELLNLGGVVNSAARIGGDFGGGLPLSVASGLVIPSSIISAFQSKSNTKLLASTQIHAFNNEDSSARIGQRIPVQTASVFPFNSGTNGGNNGNNGIGGGFPVINYEQVGLTLKFKPLVFPNQDVQVTMEIESKDRAAGPDPLTPVFTERTIKGTARIQNNKTLLLASVAQGTQTDGRAGLPILGSLPIIGRLFATPNKENSQVDIVIAVTPRVIRAPAILPEDLEERETGSLAVPTSSSLEAMVIQEEIEEQLAAARRLGNTAKVQLPDPPIDAPVYVKTDPSTTSANVETQTQVTTTAVVNNAQPETVKNNTLVTVSENNVEKKIENKVEKIKKEPVVVQPKNSVEEKIKQIDSSVRTLEIKPTAEIAKMVETPEKVEDTPKTVDLKETSLKSNFVEEIKTQPFTLTDEAVAELQLLPGTNEMKAGEKTKIAVIIKSPKAFRSAVLGLNFDPKKLAVKNIALGDIFGEPFVRREVTPFLNQGGKMYTTLSVSQDVGGNSSGVLAYIEIEALTTGTHTISFDKEVVNFLTAKGQNFAVKY